MYQQLWHLHFSIGLGNWSLHQDLRHWVNEGLMTFFFLAVGLEIRRELESADSHNRNVILLPVAGAIGGMVVPALLYITFNSSSESFRGWAIPTATDIAFAVGALALLGSRIPKSLKVFLLTLAIVDDIAAIVVIALFYGQGIQVLPIFLLLLLTDTLYVLIRIQKVTMLAVAVVGVGMWIAAKQSGMHPSIIGALIGVLMPISNLVRNRPLGETLEKWAIPFSTLIVIPLFAFANTGIPIHLQVINRITLPIAIGIIAGLVLGKFIGILSAVWLMVKFGHFALPAKSYWSQMLGIGLLAGIGFTVSLFVADLAFAHNQVFVSAAKLSIFGASAISAMLGLLVLRFLPKAKS